MRLFALLMLLTSCVTLAAQNKPQKEKIYPMVVVRHTLEWYQEQLTLWEEEVKTNPKNPDAWLNAFTAMRMVKVHNGKKTQADLDAFVEKMKTNIPGTYEYYFILSHNTSHTQHKERAENIIKAYEIDPKRPETYNPLLAVYEVKQDKEKLKEVCTQYFNLNVMSPGLMSWAYNCLISCEPNAVLLVNGDSDTFCTLIWQYAKNIRPDVVILNPHLMFYNPELRKKYFQSLGIPDFDMTAEKIDGKLVQKLCNHIRKHSDKPFYYSGICMNIPEWYEDVKDSVYWVGFAGKYSSVRFDNIAALKKNLEKNYLLDYIKVPVQNELSSSIVNEFNVAMLAPFLTLYFHYKESEESEKSQNILEYINAIATRAELTKEVNEILKTGKF